jgi:hypothetical protein
MRVFAAMALTLLVAGCAQEPEIPYASKERVAAVAYREPGPNTLTVFTMVSNRNGKGAHSSLMINGPQRVIFDPAGSFVNERVPEREDVLFGVTPAVLKGYKSAHARSTYHVVSQTIEVTPEQAAIALRLATTNGAAPRGFCTTATTGVMKGIPGFESVASTYFPTRLMEQMSAWPGVVEDRYYENDEGTIVDGVAGIVIPD